LSSFDAYFAVGTGSAEFLNPTASRSVSGDAYFSLTATFPDDMEPFSVSAGACVFDQCIRSPQVSIFPDPDHSETPQPTAIPTIYPAPRTAEEAAAALLNCGSYLVQDNHYEPDMYNYPSLESGIGESTPEAAFEAFAPYMLQGTPDFVHHTDDEVIWVYLDEQGQKIGVVTAQHTDAGWFIIREQHCASVLK
jgi:hypothetical protein